MIPSQLDSPPQSSRASIFTLRTMDDERPESPSERTPLFSSQATGTNYDGTGREPSSFRSARRPLLNAALKMAAVFLVSSVLLGGTLYFALPTLEEQDRPHLRVPKSFAQLQALNALLKKYKNIYPYRILVCFVITYLFLQAFSLPGSMYLSILAGAVWGMAKALPLCCACVATGATLCYLISAALGPALLAVPKWKARIDQWAVRVEAQRANLLSFLIVIRIAPFPPHWVVNVICPHLNIGIIPFWITTFLGIIGVTVIHTTIGGGLDDMTSADDFHLISWKNFFGLSAIVVGVLIPVGLRYFFRQELQQVATVGQDEPDEEADAGSLSGPAVFSGINKAKRPMVLELISDDEDGQGFDSEVRSFASEDLAAEEDELVAQRKEKGVALPNGWKRPNVGGSK